MKDFHTFINKKGGVPKVAKDTGMDRRILYKMLGEQGLLDMKINHYVILAKTYPDEKLSDYFPFLKYFGQ